MGTASETSSLADPTDLASFSDSSSYTYEVSTNRVLVQYTIDVIGPNTYAMETKISLFISLHSLFRTFIRYLS